MIEVPLSLPIEGWHPMPAKKYNVAFSAAERQTLQQLTTTGKAAAYKISRARIWLKADEQQAEGGWERSGDQ
jgi:hypothetical protein